jgi:DNA-binding response OmpR family regulator
MAIILAVDSQLETILADAANDLGHQFHYISNPDIALRTLSSIEIDAVIVDISQRGEKYAGIDVAQIIKQDLQTQTIAIAISDDPHHKHIALAANFDAFLLKPFDFRFLRATLQMYLTEAGMTIA